MFKLEYLMSLSCVIWWPPKRYVYNLIPRTCKYVLFGKGMFVDVIKTPDGETLLGYLVDCKANNNVMVNFYCQFGWIKKYPKGSWEGDSAGKELVAQPGRSQFGALVPIQISRCGCAYLKSQYQEGRKGHWGLGGSKTSSHGLLWVQSQKAGKWLRKQDRMLTSGLCSTSGLCTLKTHPRALW